MPSGSHGGRSGGSHGGFSGGGSSFRGGGRSSAGGGFGRRSGPSHSYGHVHMGPRRFRWFGGRTVIITSGAQSALVVLAFFIVLSFLLTIGAFSAVDEQRDYLNMIKEEQQFYLGMIADAENDSSLQVSGKVTGVFYKQDFEKYYITYEFGENDYEGYSFSIYTRENCPSKGSTIILAVDSAEIDETTDSIPMDYKNFTLEDDGEYVYAKKQVRSFVMISIATILACAGCVGGVVYIFIKAKKEKDENKAVSKQAIEEAEKKQYCQYCGSKVHAEDKTCEQCGARLR